MKISGVLLAVVLLALSVSAQCTLAGGMVVCNGKLATPSQLATIAGGQGSSSSAPTRRSASARESFKAQYPCPSTGRGYGACPGYVMDHVVPLACGGADDPSNMAWQTTEDAKAKDKWERKVYCPKK